MLKCYLIFYAKITRILGVSFSIGGEKDWRTFLTIPNILKEFNKNLYGYSTGLRSLSIHKSSGFNVAELGAISRDTPHMAKVLIQRMRADKRVDIEKHWKVIENMQKFYWKNKF
jgi:hypothetical protein